MDFEEWMRKNRWTKTAIAKELNVAASTMHNIVNGKIPYEKTRIAIENLTKGQVTTVDLAKIKSRKKKERQNQSQRQNNTARNLGIIKEIVQDIIEDVKHVNP